MKKVAVVMGSDSDFLVVEKCIKELKKYNVPFEVSVLSAHRTPEEAGKLSKDAKKLGFGVIIAAAGMAAHLAGVLAAYTTLPVIGLPIKSSFEGLDSLLATVQMPPGVPVATVAVNGGANAALLAIQMLAINDNELSNKLEESKLEMKNIVLQKNKEIQSKVDEV